MKKTDVPIHAAEAGYRAEAQRAHAEIAARFVAMHDDRMDSEFHWALAKLGAIAEVDRAYVFTLEDGGRVARKTHEWRAEGVDDPSGENEQMVCEASKPLLDPLRAGRPLIVGSFERLDDRCAALRELLRARGIRAILTAGLHGSGGLLGFIAFDCVRSAREWRSWEVESLATVGPLFVSAIQRCKAERGLRRESARSDLFERLFRHAPGLFCIAGFDGYFKVVSPYWQTLLGYSSDELCSQPFLELVHPEDRARTKAEAEKLLQPGHMTISFENRYRAKDGKHVWLSWRSIGDAERQLVFAVAEDVTAHKERQARSTQRQAELLERYVARGHQLERFREELRGNEGELFQLLESIPLGVVVVRPDGVPHFVNQSASEILGAPDLPACLSRLASVDSSAGGTEGAERSPIARALEGETVTLVEIEIDKDGKKVPLFMSAAPILATGGAIKFAIVAFQDGSEPRRLEEQLRQAQKMEAVGRLAGGVAHDFNNLLTVIFSFGHFAMQRMNEQDPAHRDIQEVLNAAKRAEVLTRQLLAFSRSQTISPRVLNVNQSLEDMASMLQRIVGEDVEVSTVPGPDPWTVYADPGALEQVVVNLVVNARDAMPQGGQLTIETRNATLEESVQQRHGTEIPPGDYVLISVADTGAGMDDETQRQIFEPFFTTKEKGRGSGLGLSTVYGVVKQAKGFIWVYSEPGIGTRFNVYLPRAGGVGKTDAPALRAHGSLEGTETILVAEDDAQVRSLVVRTLTKLGYAVLEAANGGEALLLAEDHEGPIHLLLTDVIMPRMSGKKLAARVGASHPSTVVLYMSGYTDEVVARQGILERGVQLIQKPFTPQQLALRVREVLTTADAAPLPPEPATARDPSRGRVLIVEDEDHVREALRRTLETVGHDVRAVGSTLEAERLINRDPAFDLVLCDITLPDRSGVELVHWMEEVEPELARRTLFVTGGAADEDTSRFLDTVRDKVLLKPIDVSLLLERVEAAIAGGGRR